MGTFLAAVSHRSCVNRLFTAVLTCMLRCNRNVTKWQRHSLSSLPELLCIHIQSATNMSSSSDPPSVQVQVRYFYCQCVVSTYKHVWWLWVLTIKHVWHIGTCRALYMYCSWYFLVEVNSESSRSCSDLQPDWSSCSYPYVWDLWSLQSICSLKDSTQWFSVDDLKSHTHSRT